MNTLEHKKNNRLFNKSSYLTVSVLGKSLALNINFSHTKSIELNIEDKSINIVLPNKYKKTENVHIINSAIEKMYDKIAKIEIEDSMEKARIIFGFAPDDYEIKRITDYFCKKRAKKLIINPDIVKFNKKIIDNTIMQSFCEIKYRIKSKKYYEEMKNAMIKYERLQCKLAKVS